MGPPELPGGNCLIDKGEPRVTVELQWGRRNYPAETVLQAGRLQ